ncbi:hypothetical protein DPMN_173071 [Dreissena polymorpha]|uniref:Uncharacterized protein n=1 Tax=Dreissena polymorpha TaxID=45954 RepID=A0A9D4E0X5_DREPO|nr:hypothetical protein DPMN_173071 [Dreissena polymorpha]
MTALKTPISSMINALLTIISPNKPPITFHLKVRAHYPLTKSVFSIKLCTRNGHLKPKTCTVNGHFNPETCTVNEHFKPEMGACSTDKPRPAKHC